MLSQLPCCPTPLLMRCQILDGPTFRRENLEFAAQPDRRLSNTDPAWLAVYLIVSPSSDAVLSHTGVGHHNQVQPECRDVVPFLPFVGSRAAAHGILQDQPHGSRGGRLPRSAPDQAHPGDSTPTRRALTTGIPGIRPVPICMYAQVSRAHNSTSARHPRRSTLLSAISNRPSPLPNGSISMF